MRSGLMTHGCRTGAECRVLRGYGVPGTPQQDASQDTGVQINSLGCDALMSKQVDRAHEEALLQKRIEFVAAFKEKLGNKTSAAAQTVAAYSSILDGNMLT